MVPYGDIDAARQDPIPGCDEVRKTRAGNEARTRDPQLGKLMLYQLSYSRLYFTLFFNEPVTPTCDPPVGGLQTELDD
jgi:hypothetical protein